MSAAIDAGNPVVLDSPRSRLARNYHDLAATLAAAAETASDDPLPQARTSL
jgi:MinD-like ATPase involved in chromosome partitioning or flagellar assembly